MIMSVETRCPSGPRTAAVTMMVRAVIGLPVREVLRQCSGIARITLADVEVTVNHHRLLVTRRTDVEYLMRSEGIPSDEVVEANDD